MVLAGLIEGMANFGVTNGLNELRGQHGIAFDTFGYHKTRGYIAKAQRHSGNDEKAGQGKPAQQIELPTPALACDGRCDRYRFLLLFEYRHRDVLDARI